MRNILHWIDIRRVFHLDVSFQSKTVLHLKYEFGKWLNNTGFCFISWFR